MGVRACVCVGALEWNTADLAKFFLSFILLLSLKIIWVCARVCVWGGLEWNTADFDLVLNKPQELICHKA